MSGALYLRRARLEIGTVAIPFEPDTGLRFAFKIAKNPYASQPNHAQIIVSNLNEISRKRVAAAFDPTFVGPQDPGLTLVRVFAGYRGLSGQPASTGLIFEGHSTNVVHTRRGADWETRIIAASGLLANDVRATQTFPKGIDFAAVIKTMLGILKKSLADIDISQVMARVGKADFAGAIGIAFKRPFAFDGKIMEQLDTYARANGFELSEQDGKLILLHVDETLPNSGRAFRLSAATGLVGALDPIRDDRLPGAQLLKGRSLLRHEFQIGSGIYIDSAVQKGLHKIRSLTFHGDTHGPTWYVDFHANAVQGGFAT